MLLEQIDNDFKDAMRQKNELVVGALRIAKSEIKNAEIEKHQPLTDDEVLKVLAKKVKQHKDSIAGFTAGGRADLVQHEEQQMAVLMKYLPQQMDEAAVKELVKAVIAETGAGANDFGKVMKEVLVRAKGQTDGSVVSGIVKQELAG